MEFKLHSYCKIRKKMCSKYRAPLSSKRVANLWLRKIVSCWPRASRRRSWTVIGIVVDSLKIHSEKGETLPALVFETR